MRHAACPKDIEEAWIEPGRLTEDRRLPFLSGKVFVVQAIQVTGEDVAKFCECFHLRYDGGVTHARTDETERAAAMVMADFPVYTMVTG